MKKAIFKIRMMDGSTEDRAGYILRVAGYNIGLTQYYKYDFMDEAKKGRQWIASELTAGGRFNCNDVKGSTRAEIIKNLEAFLQRPDVADRLNNYIYYAESHNRALNADLVCELEKPLKKAFSTLYSVEDACDLNNIKLTRAEYDGARDVFNDLKNNKTANTFIKGIAEFYRRCGLSVINNGALYTITV